MNIFVNHLPITYYLTKFLDLYIQIVFGILTGHHYSLFNVANFDFCIGTAANKLFNQNNNNKDYNNPDIHDMFHIYLSKLLYESPDKIIGQCINWGFNKESIEILGYIQSKHWEKYSYPTQAVVINHIESNTIIIAFRGREPRDLLEWLTDGSTNLIEINNVFNTNKIQVHPGLYYALGLNVFNPTQPIDFSQVTSDSPMFIQLLNFIQKIHQNDKQYKISITGHSLGGGLASLFSFVLLSYGYESSISGVYTYGQPLVGNRRYAKVLNDKLGNRFHRWVNHNDIVTRTPVIELSSIAWHYGQKECLDPFEVTVTNNQIESNTFRKHYYHSGLRFKINGKGHLKREKFIDEGPIIAYQDRLDSFQFIYSIRNVIHSLFNITPIRTFLWLIVPTEIKDHFPGDYARKIKNIVNINKNTFNINESIFNYNIK